MGSIMGRLLLATGVAAAAGVASCGTRSTLGDGLELSPTDTMGTVYDALVGERFDPEAGDRQRMLKGTCPGADCVVGPIVSIQPVVNSHQRGGRLEIVGRIINEEATPWTDSSLVLGPHDTVYVEMHAPSAEMCTARYRKSGFYRGTLADSTLGVAPPTCVVQHAGRDWGRGLARWQVGSLYAWFSCNRGCCRAA
jgi:hypothetical protein